MIAKSGAGSRDRIAGRRILKKLTLDNHTG